MTDPAVAYLPGEGYGPYDRGTDMDVWIKAPNGSASLGLVWPGVTVYPGKLFSDDIHNCELTCYAQIGSVRISPSQ